MEVVRKNCKRRGPKQMQEAVCFRNSTAVILRRAEILDPPDPEEAKETPAAPITAPVVIFTSSWPGRGTMERLEVENELTVIISLGLKTPTEEWKAGSFDM